MTRLTFAAVVNSTTTALQSQRDTARMVDRIGGSDSFAALLIPGFVNGRDVEAATMFAVATSALRQTILSGLLPVTPACA